MIYIIRIYIYIYRFVRRRSVVDRCANEDRGDGGNVQSCWGRDRIKRDVAETLSVRIEEHVRKEF